MVETALSTHRPLKVAKRTQTYAQKQQTTYLSGSPIALRTVDCFIIGLGYAGLGAYIYHNLQRFSLSTLELSTLTLGALGLSSRLFDIGRRNGMDCRASLLLENGAKDNNGEEDEDAWKGDFRGREFKGLKVADKIVWLQQEEVKIRGLQAEEQLKCGQAYIAKEEAYSAYEKHGNYGGVDHDTYRKADEVCQDMYDVHQKQLRRLEIIREEINDWKDSI